MKSWSRANQHLNNWKPIHLCWLFKRLGLPIPPYLVGGGSDFALIAGRIVKADRGSAWGVDDEAIVDFDKDLDLIVAASFYTSSHGGCSGVLQLRWQDKDDGSGFIAISGAGELTWTAVTDLTDNTAVVHGDEWVAGNVGYADHNDGKEHEGSAGYNVALTDKDTYHVESQWAVDFSNADAGHEYEFQIYDTTAGAAVATLLCTVTVASGAIVKIMGSTVGLSGVPIRKGAVVRLMAESAMGLVEAIVRRMWSVRLTAETEGLADAALRRARSVRLTAETVGISETIGHVAMRLMTSTVGLSEAVLRRARSIRLITATEGISEGIVRRMWSIRQMVSTVGLSDMLLRRARSVGEMASTVGITETAVKITGFVRIMAEGAIGITEAIGNVAIRLMTETEGIAEAIVQRMWSIRLVTATVGLAESAVERARSIRLMTETVGLSETALMYLRSVRQMVSTVGLTEALVRRAWSIRLMTETIGVAEGIVALIRSVRQMISTVGLTEGVVRRMRSVRQIANTITIPETVVLHRVLIKIISETLGLVEGWIRWLSGITGEIEVIELISLITSFVELDSVIITESELDSEMTTVVELGSKVS